MRRSRRLTVRTPGFHPGNRGSIPLGITRVQLHHMITNKIIHTCTTSDLVQVENLFQEASVLLWNKPLGKSIKHKLGEPFTYTVENLPRQWPGAFIYLLVNENPKALDTCLSLASVWNLFYIHDDIKDEKQARYGTKTALSIFGKKVCRVTLEKALSGMGLKDKVGKNIADTLGKLDKIQRHRFETPPSDIREYEKQSVSRLMFIREYWIRAANSVNDIALAEFIGKSATLEAKTAQLRNDLKNVHPREEEQGGRVYSDFYEGKYTFITLFTLELASPHDRAWIMSNIWKSGQRSDIEGTTKLRSICESCGAIYKAKTILNQNIERLEEGLKKSGLTNYQKNLWALYLQRTLRRHSI